MVELYRREKQTLKQPTLLPASRITTSQGWCDAPEDRNYNRLVRLPYPASCESMKRKDELYNLCIVLDYNISKRRRFGGSAIFFHVQRKDCGPTEGCVALPQVILERLLKKITRKTAIDIRQR